MALTPDQKNQLRQLVANIGGALTAQRLAQIAVMTDTQVATLLTAGGNLQPPIAQAGIRMTVLKQIDAIVVPPT